MMLSDVPNNRYTQEDHVSDTLQKQKESNSLLVAKWLKDNPEVGALNSGIFYVHINGVYTEIEPLLDIQSIFKEARLKTVSLCSAHPFDSLYGEELIKFKFDLSSKVGSGFTFDIQLSKVDLPKSNVASRSGCDIIIDGYSTNTYLVFGQNQKLIDRLTSYTMHNVLQIGLHGYVANDDELEIIKAQFIAKASAEAQVYINQKLLELSELSNVIRNV
jgi:hypothetical protein